MRLSKFWSILLIIGAHLFVALLAAVAGSWEDSDASKSVTAGRKLIFLGAGRYPAGNAVFESVKPTERYGLFCPSIDELAEVDKSPEMKKFYQLIGKERAVVLLIEMNDDAVENDRGLRLLMEKLPNSLPVIWFAMPPVDERIKIEKTNSQIARFNRKIRELCAAKENCSFVDPTGLVIDESGNLKPEYHVGDGFNFNERGSQIWANSLKSVVP